MKKSLFTAAGVAMLMPFSLSAGEISGKEAYGSVCFACHDSGAANSPKLGDKAEWAPRIAQGLDVLTGHAINGFKGSSGFMPPKGGRTDLSDEAIRAAVEYMVGKSQ